MTITLFTQRHSFYDGTFNESPWTNHDRFTMYSNQLYFVFQVPERLYQLVDRSTDGLVTADQVMEFIAGLQAIRYEKTNYDNFA